jgi:hypothetical protein
LAAIIGIIAHMITRRNPPAISAMRGSCPVTSMISRPNQHTPMPVRPQTTDSHSAMRALRRTSRTAWRRRPSSVAISAATIPVRPEKHHIISPNSAIDRLEAASCASPSRATKITSIA